MLDLIEHVEVVVGSCWTHWVRSLLDALLKVSDDYYS